MDAISENTTEAYRYIVDSLFQTNSFMPIDEILKPILWQCYIAQNGNNDKATYSEFLIYWSGIAASDEFEELYKYIDVLNQIFFAMGSHAKKYRNEAEKKD